MRAAPVAIVLLTTLLLIRYPWVNALPTDNLNAIVLLGSSNGWAVGNSGTIVHFDGTFWNAVPSGTGADLLGISFGPPNALMTNAGFAVGGTGGTAAALFWSGVGWSAENAGLTAPGAQRLASVFALSSSDAWAVDSVSGSFWHWSGAPGLGGGWSLAASAIAGLNSVFMTSSSEGWAVGLGGVIYRYSGGGWTLTATVGTTLNSVFMLDTNEGWAAGNAGAIYHYSLGSWNGPVSPSTTSEDLKSVFMIAPSEGWAVGTSGTILHYSSGGWTAVPQNLLATNQNLNSVYFSGGRGWAVGDSGTMVTLGGQLVQGNPATAFQDVYLSNANDGWIVGCATGGCGTGSGEPVVAHWNGASFTRGTVLAAPSDFYSVSMVNPSEGWAVGGVGATPTIIHYSGAWNQVPAPASTGVLRSVYMVDSNNGWAVGDSGTILHYSGGLWSFVSSPTTNSLRSVFMLGSGDGWAVGDSGTLLRYQSLSGQWLSIPSPTGANLNSVFLSDATHGWAVGSGGVILHYDGILWVNVAGLTSSNLNSVFQVNPQDAWAVGDSATIVLWNGIAWYPIAPSPPITGTPDLNSVFIESTGFGLIVGEAPAPGNQGTVLQIPSAGPIPEFPNLQFFSAISFIITIALIVISRKKSAWASPRKFLVSELLG